MLRCVRAEGQDIWFCPHRPGPMAPEVTNVTCKGDKMHSAEFQSAFNKACSDLGLDPANTNMFALECRRQGLDPQRTRAFDLDKNPSDMWAQFRKLKSAS